MKQFELFVENPYGNKLIAIFMNKQDLIEFTKAVPTPAQYHYFVMEKETSEQRISFETFVNINTR